MTKIPYEILSVEVNKLYTKEFSPEDNQGIIEHCEFIRKFIESCGWTVESYIDRMWIGTGN